MSSTRTWVAGTAAVSVLLVLGAWFLLISPKRADAANLRQQRVTATAANQQLRLQIAELKAEFATLPAKQAELAVIERQLPSNAQLPTLIRSLSSMAGAAGVDLNSIAPGNPLAQSAQASSGAASATGSTQATGATAATTSASAQVVAIPISIIVDGTYAQNELFLQKLQTTMTRAFLVQGLAVGPQTAGTSAAGSSSTSTTAPDGSILRTTITGSVFVLQPPAASTTTSTSGSAASTATPAKTAGSAS